MAIDIIQIVSAILLIVVILMQSRGAGLGSAFGGGQDGVYHAKRGAEKGLFILTIILSVVFLATALINIIF